jgi:UDP-N-acetyl-D-mannosaminuronate dehydrogenase
MPEHVVELISNAFDESNQTLENSKILILGISYKPNIKDIQLSPAKIIVEKLQKLGVDVYLYDPFFNSTVIFGLETQNNLENILPEMDGAIIVTGHDDFKNISISSFSKMKHSVLVDTRGIIDPVSAKKEKIIFRGLGRGGF